MNSQTTFDYIIVGQGLAGSCLAIQLLQRKKKILVIDRYNENSATQVAAGLFNPITGRKMTKTWLADTLFPYLHNFYPEIERLSNQKFFNPMTLYRPFTSIEEQNEWMGKSTDQELSPYIASVQLNPVDITHIKNPYGGLSLKQCGYLDTPKFCQASRNYIRDNASLLEAEFFEKDLIIEKDSVLYLGHQSRKIIFCEGEEVRFRKLFSWLPIKPLKGETITIKTEAKISTIFNRGVYVIPNLWKIGATYQFNDTTRSVTREAREELMEKLTDLVNFPFEVVDQTWGMRPTTPDRRPVIGCHPEYPAVAIFNGLGTKGVSLAPYFSHVLTEWLENNVPINKEVDIHRYKHYNYGGNFLR